MPLVRKGSLCLDGNEEQVKKLYRKFDKVPAVIDREMIMDSVIDSASTTVCKKLFKRKKLEYEYIFKLYLDFKGKRKFFFHFLKTKTNMKIIVNLYFDVRHHNSIVEFPHRIQRALLPNS